MTDAHNVTAQELRKIIRDRKLKRDELAEFEAIEELYRQAVGMA